MVQPYARQEAASGTAINTHVITFEVAHRFILAVRGPAASPHLIHSLHRIRENGLMRIRRFVRFIPALFLILAQPSRASGPFQSACANQEQAAEDTLKDLKTCLEKAGAKTLSRGSADVCAKAIDAHQAALSGLKECLAGPSALPNQKAEAN